MSLDACLINLLPQCQHVEEVGLEGFLLYEQWLLLHRRMKQQHSYSSIICHHADQLVKPASSRLFLYKKFTLQPDTQFYTLSL